MATVFNPARVKVTLALEKSAQKITDKLSNPESHDISLKDYTSKVKKISRYIDTSRDYLRRVKSQCNQVIDGTFKDATCLTTALQSIGDTHILTDKPSDFLQKAYTEQTFHANEKENINREQAYIDAGKEFDIYCRDNPENLTEKEKLFNDFGTVIAAINGAISQMNRTEHAIHSLSSNASNDDYLVIFMNIKQISALIQVLTKEVADKKPNVLNSKGGILANAYEDFLAMMEKFTAFYQEFCNRHYKHVSREEQNREVEMNKSSMKNKSSR